MNKLIPIAALCCVLTQYALADSSAANNQVKVYTDNFAIASGSSSGAATQAVDEQIIGKVGSLNIVAGEKPKGVIAYVQQSAKPDYLIYDSLLVKCKKNITCVPSEYNASRLGNSNLYQIKVSDYSQWQQTIDNLKNNSDVLKVAPNYEYGHKPSLK